MKKAIILLSIILFLLAIAFANSTEKRLYTAMPINPHPPVIDGKLDDPIWEKAEWAGDFIQREPYEGKEPSQKTAFKILYDEKSLYVAIRAFDSEPDKIVRRVSRRDKAEGDWVCVDIDSYYDHRTAFSFAVNAAGVKSDMFISDDGQNRDRNWDPIWYVKTAVDDEGWTAEMGIPLSQLRFGNKENQVWGLQVMRNLFRKEESSGWQFIPRDSSGWVHEFGELHGLKGIKASRQIELFPYTVGNLQTFQREEGNPFATGRLSQLMGGLDGKIGLTSDLTLDFTINPDFGQVEADPSVVNLTAFETYFEEKRPFFIEGRNILSFRLMLGDGDFSSDNLFYSRRIGRRPQHTPDLEDDEYVDMPQNTSILGAFKLTGKTKNGLSIGIIDSITSEEKARVSYLGQLRHETVEPLTNYLGFRLQKDYNKGSTVIGTMLTATNRNIKNQELSFLHSAAYTGGVDLYHSWKNRTYFIQANAVFSHVRGSTDAILRTQESPLRYYQRPDTAHVSLDPNRTSLSGHGGTVVFGKLGSGNLQYVGGVTWRSPGLELNDMGYLRSADRILQFVWVGYRILKPFSMFRRINFGFNQWKGWDFGGTNIFDGGNMHVFSQFKNYWRVGLGVNRQGESLFTTALRGGPMLRWPGGWSRWFSLNSDSRKKIRLNGFLSRFTRDSGNSGSNSYSIGVTYYPTNALALSVAPFLRFSENDLQYVKTSDFGEEKRYIFSRIDQKTLGITLRLSYSLTPDLSIQFYGQPFVSVGKYAHFKRITEPQAGEYRDRYHQFTESEISYDSDSESFDVDENQDGMIDYSFENPNFDFLQFRSNLVIRWEYRPGSALYLVWSQGRADVYQTGDLSFKNGMRDLFEIPAHNVFLIKFSYGFQL